MKYSEAVYKRIRNGKVYYDGMLRYHDDKGKRKTLHRERTTKSAAREALRQALNDLEERGPKALENNVVTFALLADYCEKEIYVEAEYNSAGEKLFGVRNGSAYKAPQTLPRLFWKQKAQLHFHRRSKTISLPSASLNPTRPERHQG